MMTTTASPPSTPPAATEGQAPDLPGILRTFRANTGQSLDEISRQSPALVVFLRHTGCPFCREAMRDMHRQREAIAAAGVMPVFVHQGPEDDASRAIFESERVADIPRISDPDRRLYQAFELRRGNLWQMFGPKVWWRSMQAIATGSRAGRVVGDAFQMPGVFVLHKGRIVRAFRHASQADRPDYQGISCDAARCTKDWGRE